MGEFGWFRDQSIGQNGILSCSVQHPNTGLQSPSSVHRKGFTSAKMVSRYESRINGADAAAGSVLLLIGTYLRPMQADPNEAVFWSAFTVRPQQGQLSASDFRDMLRASAEKTRLQLPAKNR
jgi:hypothetical protein